MTELFDMEPVLDTTDIQGHIFPGFGTSHTVLIGINVRDLPETRASLSSLIPEITTMEQGLGFKALRKEAVMQGMARPQQQFCSLTMAFSASMVRKLGHDTSGFDPSFHMGMLNDAASLGDLVDGNHQPIDWKFGTNENDQIDILLTAGHSDLEALNQAVDRWLSLFVPSNKAVFVEYGRRREGDKEFFGFKDGVSQPAMRGVTSTGKNVSTRAIDSSDPRSEIFARPGQPLVWPGSFIFGYPDESTKPKEPGPVAVPPASWMKNGSYLVFRRLNQDVESFDKGLEALQMELKQNGDEVSKDWIAAKMVGRWPDGTPISVSASGPDQSVSDDLNQVNNFRFLSGTTKTKLTNGDTIPAVPADPIGFACPRVSHIRKVNPRDGISEIGLEHHMSKLMMRRGTAFGPEYDDEPSAERGLLFLSYQTSIVDQFKFIQSSWANAKNRPTGDGPDPLIGQDRTNETQRTIKLFGPNRRQRICALHGRWIIATGGSYMVSPGIEGLKELLSPR